MPSPSLSAYFYFLLFFIFNSWVNIYSLYETSNGANLQSIKAYLCEIDIGLLWSDHRQRLDSHMGDQWSAIVCAGRAMERYRCVQREQWSAICVFRACRGSPYSTLSCNTRISNTSHGPGNRPYHSYSSYNPNHKNHKYIILLVYMIDAAI